MASSLVPFRVCPGLGRRAPSSAGACPLNEALPRAGRVGPQLHTLVGEALQASLLLGTRGLGGARSLAGLATQSPAHGLRHAECGPRPGLISIARKPVRDPRPASARRTCRMGTCAPAGGLGPQKGARSQSVLRSLSPSLRLARSNCCRPPGSPVRTREATPTCSPTDLHGNPPRRLLVTGPILQKELRQRPPKARLRAPPGRRHSPCAHCS